MYFLVVFKFQINCAHFLLLDLTDNMFQCFYYVRKLWNMYLQCDNVDSWREAFHNRSRRSISVATAHVYSPTYDIIVDRTDQEFTIAVIRWHAVSSDKFVVKSATERYKFFVEEHPRYRDISTAAGRLTHARGRLNSPTRERARARSRMLTHRRSHFSNENRSAITKNQ